MNKIIKFFKRKDGYAGLPSIVYPFIFLMGILLVMWFSEIVSRTYLINETQSIMDTSGLAALRQGLDDEELRVENFVVDESVVKTQFKELVSKALGEYEAVVDHRFIRVETRTFKETFGLGLSQKERDQAMLDATIMLVVDSYGALDTSPVIAKQYFDAYENDNFQVNYVGVNEDGQVEITIRSVTRLVYR